MEVAKSLEFTGVLIYLIFLVRNLLTYRKLSGEQKESVKSINRSIFGNIGNYWPLFVLVFIIGSFLFDEHREFIFFAFFCLCLTGHIFQYLRIKQIIVSTNLPEEYITSILFSNRFLILGLFFFTVSFLIKIIITEQIV